MTLCHNKLKFNIRRGPNQKAELFRITLLARPRPVRRVSLICLLVPLKNLVFDSLFRHAINAKVSTGALISYLHQCILAARSKAGTVFAQSNTGIVGSNPTYGMHVCVRLFCVCASCVQVAALLWADPPSKEAYPLCKRPRNWKAAKAQQRVVEP
jgi:hypothetical protein